MSTLTFSWNALPYAPGKRGVKGTELAQAIVPHTQSRFAVCETVALDGDGNHTTVYRLRDAHTVSDADIRNCVRPKIVGVFPSPEDAACAAYELMEKDAVQ